MRLLLLVIDAGDSTLLRDWAADGILPTVRSLLATGVVGDTMSVDGLYEGATWPSFYTGANPARHGFHNWAQLSPGAYDYVRAVPGRGSLGFGGDTPEPFWDRLSRAGKRVVVLDVPLVAPSPSLNGVQLIEWGSHDAVQGFHTWPQELRSDVLRRFGKYPAPRSCDGIGKSPRDFRAFRQDLIAGVMKKRDLTLGFLAREEWDVFIQVFAEAHCAGHQCWHLHDPAHPNHDPAIAAQTGDPLRDVYGAIDAAIGSIMSAAGPDTIRVLLAPHGMAHNIGADFLLEDVLERLGALTRVREPPGPGAARTVFRRLPPRVRNRLRPAARIASRILTGTPWPVPPSASTRIDMARSRCFPHMNGGLVSGIRVNQRGREPEGVIQPGRETEELCRRLSEDLLEVHEAASGSRMVKRVLVTSQLYEGERLGHLPDLLVEWSDEVRVASKALRGDDSCRLGLTSDKIGLVEGEYAGCRTGNHRPQGLFVVTGGAIEPSVLDRTVSIMDLAPTFLGWFGVSHPDGMDGSPIDTLSSAGAFST